jgi:hypothetical protein
VKKLSRDSYDAFFEVSRDASLRKIVQVATDIAAIKRLYEQWGIGGVLSVDIDLDDSTGYCLRLEGDKIYRYIGNEMTPLTVGVHGLEPQMGEAFRFLFFLIQKERSE